MLLALGGRQFNKLVGGNKVKQVVEGLAGGLIFGFGRHFTAGDLWVINGRPAYIYAGACLLI